MILQITFTESRGKVWLFLLEGVVSAYFETEMIVSRVAIVMLVVAVLLLLAVMAIGGHLRLMVVLLGVGTCTTLRLG